MIQVTKIKRSGSVCIGLSRKIVGSTYDADLQLWHIPYSKEAWKSFLKLELPYQVISDCGTTSSPHIASVKEAREPACDKTAIVPDGTHSAICLDKFVGKAAIRRSLKISLLSGKFVLQTEFIEGRIQKIKELRASW